MATTVRVDEKTHSALRELASSSGESMSAVMQKAIDSYRRRRFLEEANRAFAALRADEDAWNEELKERELWEATLADGIDPETVDES